MCSHSHTHIYDHVFHFINSVLYVTIYKFILRCMPDLQKLGNSKHLIRSCDKIKYITNKTFWKTGKSERFLKENFDIITLKVIFLLLFPFQSTLNM